MSFLLGVISMSCRIKGEGLPGSDPLVNECDVPRHARANPEGKPRTIFELEQLNAFHVEKYCTGIEQTFSRSARCVDEPMKSATDRRKWSFASSIMLAKPA